MYLILKQVSIYAFIFSAVTIVSIQSFWNSSNDNKRELFVFPSYVPECKEYLMMAHLKDSEEAIEQYEYYHSKEGVWPEVLDAARISGMCKIKIYRSGNTLIMILGIPQDANLESVTKKYASTSPKLREWADLMAKFQVVPEGDNEKIWKPLKLIHHYEDGELWD
jgi:L-rhamnose mutarotase